MVAAAAALSVLTGSGTATAANAPGSADRRLAYVELVTVPGFSVSYGEPAAETATLVTNALGDLAALWTITPASYGSGVTLYPNVGWSADTATKLRNAKSAAWERLRSAPSSSHFIMEASYYVVLYRVVAAPGSALRKQRAAAVAVLRSVCRGQFQLTRTQGVAGGFTMGCHRKDPGGEYGPGSGYPGVIAKPRAALAEQAGVPVRQVKVRLL